MKNHLKRPYAPKRWNILRKANKFIARPNPGAHPFDNGIPLVVMLRDMAKAARNAKEVRYMMTKYDVLVDGKKRRDSKMIVGLMDVISMPASKEFLRVIIDEDGKLKAAKISDKESGVKLCKISGKKMTSKMIQLTMHDGRTIMTDKNEFRTGDSILIEVPSQKIVEHVRLEPKSMVYLVGGKHSGSTGTVEDVAQSKITYKTKDGHTYETLKKYAFVIGKSKPLVSLSEN